MKQNYKMTISYDGTRFYGWEHQPNLDMTIQGKLETVLSRMTDSEVTVIGAGRTDAGVHAKAMIANAILDTEKNPAQIRDYMNQYLPEDIAVQEIKPCAEQFHARYKARGKIYCYTCYIGDTKPVFQRKYMWVLEKQPDVARMQAASEYLLGEHDFKSFCGNKHMKKSTVRRIDAITIKKKGDTLKFFVEGSGFLQNMVRILVGTLLDVGYGRFRPEQMQEILEAKNRQAAGPTAPPQGLMLMKVMYD